MCFLKLWIELKGQSKPEKANSPSRIFSVLVFSKWKNKDKRCRITSHLNWEESSLNWVNGLSDLGWDNAVEGPIKMILRSSRRRRNL